jgi:RES domain-containing protein
LILWRISGYADLSGRGGILAGGRWHTAGRPVVYLAGSPSGAMLEILVHLEIDQEDLPETFQLLKVELPDDVSIAPPPDLPLQWASDLSYTKALGDSFLTECPALLLPVPSAIMPHSLNYLFNPLHGDCAKVEIAAEPFTLDTRLIKKP